MRFLYPYAQVLLPALEPHPHLARLVAGLDVHDAGPAAHGAVFGVDLRVAAARVDEELLGLAAKRARDGCRFPRGAAFPSLLLDKHGVRQPF